MSLKKFFVTLKNNLNYNNIVNKLSFFNNINVKEYILLKHNSISNTSNFNNTCNISSLTQYLHTNNSYYNKTNIYSNIISRKRKALTFRKTLGHYNYKIGKRNFYKNPHAVSLKEFINYKYSKDKKEIARKKYKFSCLYSYKPYGIFTSKGRFIGDKSKVPIYDIPNSNVVNTDEDFDLEKHEYLKSIHKPKVSELENKFDKDFYLKPFIHVKAPKIENRLIEDFCNGKINHKKILKKIRTQLIMNEDLEVRKLGLELFETDFGNEVINEYLEICNNKKSYASKTDFKGDKIKNYIEIDKFVFDKKDMSIESNRKELYDKITLKDFDEDEFEEDDIEKLDVKAIEDKNNITK